MNEKYTHVFTTKAEFKLEEGNLKKLTGPWVAYIGETEELIYSNHLDIDSEDTYSTEVLENLLNRVHKLENEKVFLTEDQYDAITSDTKAILHIHDYPQQDIMYTQAEADAINSAHLVSDINGVEPGEDGYETTYDADWEEITTDTIRIPKAPDRTVQYDSNCIYFIYEEEDGSSFDIEGGGGTPAFKPEDASGTTSGSTDSGSTDTPAVDEPENPEDLTTAFIDGDALKVRNAIVSGDTLLVKGIVMGDTILLKQ